MLSLSTVLLTTNVLLSSVLALPAANFDGPGHTGPYSSGPHGPLARCLNSTEASYLITGFSSLLTAYTTTTAETLLSSNFTDTSQSINRLGGYPLDGPTFPSKQAFEAGQGSQPPIGLTVLGSDYSCSNVFFRWEATVGSGSKGGVKGINWLGAVWSAANGWQIETVYSEFNSITWFENLGGVCAVPQS